MTASTDSTAPVVDHDLEVAKLEAVEMYAATVTAWYATAMEFDRTVVTLSAAAIGLLVALATTGVTTLDRWEAHAFSAALLSFCIALGCMLAVFRLNKEYLVEMVVKRSKARQSHPFLAALDWTALIFFGLGAALAIVVAVATVQKKLASPKEVATMSNKSDSTSRVPVFDSVNKALAMHPEFGKSFNGAAQLQPSVTPVAPAQPVAAATPVVPDLITPAAQAASDPAK